jgi:hypothetical protein
MMSEQAIEFLQEWISEKVQCPPAPIKLEAQAERLAKRCAAEAADAGVALEEIEEEVGNLEDLMVTKLEDAAEAEKAGAQFRRNR